MKAAEFANIQDGGRVRGQTPMEFIGWTLRPYIGTERTDAMLREYLDLAEAQGRAEEIRIAALVRGERGRNDPDYDQALPAEES